MRQAQGLLSFFSIALVGSAIVLAACASSTTMPVSSGPILAPNRESGTGERLGTFAPANPPGSSLTTIYSDLGTGNSVYDCCNAWDVGGPHSPKGQQWIAIGFTPTGNHTVTELQLALSWIFGPNAATIRLTSDRGGIPGPTLAYFHVTGLPNFKTCCTLQTLNIDKKLVLQGGTQYWVVARTTEDTQRTLDGWNFNTTNASGPFAVNQHGTWFNEGVQPMIPAFAVYGH